MVIHIKPTDFEKIKEVIAIHPRPTDEVSIVECFNGFEIPTDKGIYGISMRDGGIEVSLRNRGDEEARMLGDPIETAKEHLRLRNQVFELGEFIVNKLGRSYDMDNPIGDAIELLKDHPDFKK